MKKLLATSTLSLALFAGVSSGVVQAQSLSGAADALTQGWSGSATLGASSATGNSEASSISGSIRLGKTVEKWEHLVYGSIFKGTSTVVVEQRDAQGDLILDDDGRPVRDIIKGDNSNRLALGYQPKYYWRPRTYFFGLLDYETDEPANIDASTRQVIGIGHRFFSDASGFLSGELGFGNKTLDPVYGDDQDGAIGYLGVNYLNRLTDNVTFNADLRSDFGDSTFVELGLGLAVKVTEGIALKVSHFTRSNADITDLDDGNPLSSSNDSVTTFNVVIDI